MSTFTTVFPSALSDLLALMTTSRVLDDAIQALGAMSASRLGTRAISTLRVSLSDKSHARGDDVLWATFLLGLFELLCEGSGDGYISHVFYGTSMLLRLVPPSSSMSPLRRAFYDIFRVCEASRALPHSETTILSEPTWLRFQEAHQGSGDHWNPLEEITTLMIETSAFNLRSRNTISRIPSAELATNPSVLCLAVDGQRLQQTICAWHDHALAYLSQGHHQPRTNVDLALLKYHTLLLFLSGGTHDSFPNWTNLPGPALTQSETCDHVTLILDLSERILRHSSAPGILLFFPLTIAGCRTRREDQRVRIRILSLLDQVLCSGFGTAKRVRETILQCWSRRDAEDRVRIESAVS
ncbi:hypothetical protein ASPCAL07592 [Aspergillus calidoustus]|uniref:Uncharacterized protein n=1 Tax=Aspergillus calidoustus TaxID=454130 RepID=A0A0U4ZY49_ASPCI|nr:hypothetical protein ASPCAL07592 [Aspergillus calidoustus]